MRHAAHAATLRWSVGSVKRRCSCILGILVAITLCLSTASVLATPAKMPTIVLESDVGERPANINEIIAPLLDELAGHGFVVKPTAIASLLGQRAPRPGILDKGKSAKEIAHQVEIGLEAFRTGQFKDAEEALALAVQLIQRNPGLWVLDGANASLTYKAFVKLAAAQAQNGHADESVATMLDLLRMSSIPVTQTKDGPRAAKIFAGAEKLAQTMGRGSLVVSVSSTQAVIFVDGQFRGIGKIAVGDLIPGPRHMFVQVGAEGRQYEIPIHANDETSLEINWDIDSALTVDERCAALSFGTQSERAKEGVYARQLARQWGSEKVIVIGLTRLEGNLEVIGTVYPADGSAARRASVAVSEGETGMRSLGRFLFDGTLTGHLNVIERGPGVFPSTAEGTDGHLSVPSKILLGAGGVAAVGGIATYVLSKTDDHMSETYNDHKTPAVNVVVASSPVLGLGVYLGLRDMTSASRTTSAILGAGTASLLAGTVLYLTDEDPYNGPGQVRQYYRDSARSGLIIGGTGIVLTGLGAWLWYRESDDGSDHGSSGSPAPASEQGKALTSAVPTVSVGPSHLILSYAGSF